MNAREHESQNDQRRNQYGQHYGESRQWNQGPGGGQTQHTPFSAPRASAQDAGGWSGRQAPSGESFGGHGGYQPQTGGGSGFGSGSPTWAGSSYGQSHASMPNVSGHGGYQEGYESPGGFQGQGTQGFQGGRDERGFSAGPGGYGASPVQQHESGRQYGHEQSGYSGQHTYQSQPSSHGYGTYGSQSPQQAGYGSTYGTPMGYGHPGGYGAQHGQHQGYASQQQQGYEGQRSGAGGSRSTGWQHERGYQGQTGREGGSATLQRPGKAPRDYKRSDDRISEDICEAIVEQGIDASDVHINVKDGAVTLKGHVSERREKHQIEDIADYIRGVQSVENQIKVRKSDRTHNEERDVGRGLEHTHEGASEEGQGQQRTSGGRSK